MLWRTGPEQPAARREEGGLAFAEVAWAVFPPLDFKHPRPRGVLWDCTVWGGAGGGDLVCGLCPRPSTEQL